MGTKDKLQQLCRKYLKKLYRKARDIGLDEFVERTITENENGRCTATVEQVNMLASLCGDDRIGRKFPTCLVCHTGSATNKRFSREYVNLKTKVSTPKWML